MSFEIMSQKDALECLAAISTFLAGQPAPAPPPPTAAAPQIIGPGTVTYLKPGYMPWPIPLRMLLDTGQFLELSLGNIASASADAQQIASGKTALTNLLLVQQQALSTGVLPHGKLTVLPPVQSGGYWFLVSFESI